LSRPRPKNPTDGSACDKLDAGSSEILIGRCGRPDEGDEPVAVGHVAELRRAAQDKTANTYVIVIAVLIRERGASGGLDAARRGGAIASDKWRARLAIRPLAEGLEAFKARRIVTDTNPVYCSGPAVVWRMFPIAFGPASRERPG
jgi:hypothetical protein